MTERGRIDFAKVISQYEAVVSAALEYFRAATACDRYYAKPRGRERPDVERGNRLDIRLQAAADAVFTEAEKLAALGVKPDQAFRRGVAEEVIRRDRERKLTAES